MQSALLSLINIIVLILVLTQKTVDSMLIWCWANINPLSPHDALKHHFTYLKTDFILLKPKVSERKFNETGLSIHDIFLNFETTSDHIHPLQVDHCDSNSRLVVDEYDNGKLRLERVLSATYKIKVANSTLLLRDDHNDTFLSAALSWLWKDYYAWSEYFKALLNNSIKWL